MKLMMIMVSDADKDKVLNALINKGYTPTYIATTGEFLHYGKSILLLGVEEKEIKFVKKIIEENTTLQISEDECTRFTTYVINAECIKTNV